MGWTFTYRESGMSHLDWFIKYMGDGRDGGKGLIAAAPKGGTVYGAYRTNEPGEPERVRALVLLTKWAPNDPRYNFGWKDMDESMGPCECRCPKKIFDMLTPLSDEEKAGCAGRWRKRALAHLDGPKIRKGATYFWKRESWMNWPDGLICQDGRRLIFATDNGYRWKLRKDLLEHHYLQTVVYSNGATWENTD